MEHQMAIILAAGEGKRMKSKHSKVAHEISGKSLIEWVFESVKNAGVDESIIIIGHRGDQVKEILGDRAKYALQEKQLGTGHAVMQAVDFLKDKDGCVLVLYGDTPLITAETVKNTITFHKEQKNSATVITADLDDPTGYGRIIRNSVGNVQKIVEHRDTTKEEQAVKEVNSGLYCFNIKDLLDSLKELKNDNSQNEYYLTDTLEILASKGLKVGAIKVSDVSEILGINDRIQLHQASVVIRDRILEKHMKAGVTIIDTNSTYIDGEVEIGSDTIIYPGTSIEGGTKIDEDCIIGPNTRIVSSLIGKGVEIRNSVITESSVDSDTHIGPFAYLRPGSNIGKNVKIGDFVEVKKSRIDDNTKVSHLTYIGDAEIGKNVNLGCGVVVVNYDGVSKNKTIVEDNAFIGCNVNLVSPVTIKEGAYVAAGSTITEEVPGMSLAIARSRQVVKEDWVSKKGLKKQK